ncbi:MAG: recombinase family protein [Prevotellaceae bacterium]|jgi:DNA invertase Pin-like site-specific DNA recombinase|nr:recombinase family protein [Prevotellaceae bacterium]
MKIAYARVSTRQQNLDIQLEAFRKEGCEKIYQEKKSAFADRPELIRAMEDLRTGDTLYVWALDRLGRTVFEVIGNVRKIHDKGATLNVTVQKIDTGTAAGKMMIPLFSMLAELEIELKRERAAAGIRIAREQGRRLGRKPGLPPEAQEKAKTAQKLYLSKDPAYSVREICRMLHITPKTMYKYLDFTKTELKGGTVPKSDK